MVHINIPIFHFNPHKILDRHLVSKKNFITTFGQYFLIYISPYIFNEIFQKYIEYFDNLSILKKRKN